MTRDFPKPLGDSVDHYWLVQSMARATGVNLSDAISDGRLTEQGWADMVTRCRGCEWERDGGCSRWLSQLKSELETVPPQCANAAFFANEAGVRERE